MRYYRDKNGRELRGIYGYRIRDDKGQYFDMFGTGLVIPPDIDRVLLWTRDQKMVYRRTDEIEVVMSEESEVRMAVAIAMGGVIAFALFMKMVGAL